MPTCTEPTCKADITFLVSAKDPKRKVPVDTSSLTPDDVLAIQSDDEVTFDRLRGHVSHFTTCTAPRQFSRKNKKE